MRREAGEGHAVGFYRANGQLWTRSMSPRFLAAHFELPPELFEKPCGRGQDGGVTDEGERGDVAAQHVKRRWRKRVFIPTKIGRGRHRRTETSVPPEPNSQRPRSSRDARDGVPAHATLLPLRGCVRHTPRDPEIERREPLTCSAAMSRRGVRPRREVRGGLRDGFVSRGTGGRPTATGPAVPGRGPAAAPTGVPQRCSRAGARARGFRRRTGGRQVAPRADAPFVGRAAMATHLTPCSSGSSGCAAAAFAGVSGALEYVRRTERREPPRLALQQRARASTGEGRDGAGGWTCSSRALARATRRATASFAFSSFAKDAVSSERRRASFPASPEGSESSSPDDGRARAETRVPPNDRSPDPRVRIRSSLCSTPSWAAAARRRRRHAASVCRKRRNVGNVGCVGCVGFALLGIRHTRDAVPRRARGARGGPGACSRALRGGCGTDAASPARRGPGRVGRALSSRRRRRRAGRRDRTGRGRAPGRLERRLSRMAAGTRPPRKRRESKCSNVRRTFERFASRSERSAERPPRCLSRTSSASRRSRRPRQPRCVRGDVATFRDARKRRATRSPPPRPRARVPIENAGGENSRRRGASGPGDSGALRLRLRERKRVSFSRADWDRVRPSVRYVAAYEMPSRDDGERPSDDRARTRDEARGSRSERKDHERKDGGANGETEALRNGRSDDLPPFETLPLHFSVKERPRAEYD